MKSMAAAAAAAKSSEIAIFCAQTLFHFTIDPKINLRGYRGWGRQGWVGE